MQAIGMRATKRVVLACQALSAAAADLEVARQRGELSVEESTADQLKAEVERVCELAYELERCATNLGALTGTRSS
jgi:hypothetical protein